MMEIDNLKYVWRKMDELSPVTQSSGYIIGTCSSKNSRIPFPG